MTDHNLIGQMINAQDPAAFHLTGCLLSPDCPYVPARRTPEQEQIHRDIVNSWDVFSIKGSYKDSDKAWLWQPVTDRLGQPFLVHGQQTGSCVGNGGGQATAYLMAFEAWRLNQPEEVDYPLFYLYPYGRSRVYANLRGPGEGSFGSAYAKAAKEDGIFAASLPDLPKWRDERGLTWGRETELKWSWIPNGSQMQNTWGPIAKRHPVQSVAQIRNSREAAESLLNGYPMTCASMWGGRMQCRVQDGVLLNEQVDRWAHQMCIIGYYKHPRLGELFYVLNSWGDVHGTCPTGAPRGGFWVRAKDVDFMCRDEVFAFSNFQGFPAKEINWASIWG